MESSEQLHNLLNRLETAGEKAGTGSFGLDPKRALELLREQGQLGQNAPLYLMRALYEHLDGGAVQWKRSMFGYQLRYPAQQGILAPSTYRTLAEGAFQNLSVRLKFLPGCVQFAGHAGLELFEKALPRLNRYPLEGLGPADRGESSPWLEKTFPEGRLLLYLPYPQSGVEWVIHGVSFMEACSLPLKVLVYDDGLRADLSLSSVPESERKREWNERAQSLLDDYLSSVLEESERIDLDSRFLSDTEHTALRFLPYLQSLPEDHPTRTAAFSKVYFKDVFSQYWSLGELAERGKEEGALLVVPSVPPDCPAEPLGKRPVILWRGDTKLYGESVFGTVQSGAGYLYSLRRGEETHIRAHKGSGVLAERTFELGTLELKSMGRADSRCEIELLGRRRNSETVHLEPPAPSGLRLRWTSPEEVARFQRDDEFQGVFRHQVVLLIEQAFEQLGCTVQWLLDLLEWSFATPLSALHRLREEPLFETLDGRLVSLAEATALHPVPTLEDRSASIPPELPYDTILWWSPLFERWALDCKDVRLELRRAFWRQQGRAKWLERYQPGSPEEHSLFQNCTWTEEKDHWRWARVPEGIAGGRLVIWREGRPLGDKPAHQVEDDLIAVYHDDHFPADDYWSGPDLGALEELLTTYPGCSQ